ncbi:MAG: transposase [Chloroflexi bacterium]|nr:transposase [Chloroflexota bacterium]
MIVTHTFACKLPSSLADSLNRESGRIYTAVMVEHWRILRHTGHWLSPGAARKLQDRYDEGSKLLHSHSIDAAQQAFYKACKTIRQLRKMGDPQARYPRRRRSYRTTIWKNTGISKQGTSLRLALARGIGPVLVALPAHLAHLAGEAFKEARLVYDRKSKRYNWHVVVEDGREPPDRSDWSNVAAIDLGEIHPAVASDTTQAVVFSCRELRATIQYRNKRLAELSSRQAHCQKKSRQWWQLQRRKNRVSQMSERKQRDLCHKVSRAVVAWAIERQVARLVIGDVRDIADGKRLPKQSQQKISQWPHGLLRRYLTYKARDAGIDVVLREERYTSQSCPRCRHCTKPRGRVYTCPQCHFVGHRDVVGAGNLLSLELTGELGSIYAKDVRFRHPYKVSRLRPGSPAGIGHVA